MGQHEAEDGDGHQYIFVADGGRVFERGARYGAEDVHGYGADTQLLQFEGQLDALLQSLTHADDAARADFEPHLLGRADGLLFLLRGVRGAEFGKVGRGGLEVAVVALHAGLFQLLQLLPLEQAHRGAQLQVGFAAHAAVQVAEVVEVGAPHAAAAGDEREPLDTLRLVEPGHRHGLLFGYGVVGLDAGVVVGRLGAPLAVFGAVTRAGVDNGATVEGAVAELPANLVGRGVELGAVGMQGQVDGLVGSNLSAGQYTVFNLL